VSSKTSVNMMAMNPVPQIRESFQQRVYAKMYRLHELTWTNEPNFATGSLETCRAFAARIRSKPGRTQDCRPTLWEFPIRSRRRTYGNFPDLGFRGPRSTTTIIPIFR
jgi:hypothetical protein